MNIEEYIEQKKKILAEKLKKIEKDWNKLYPDEKPNPIPNTFEKWDNYFSDEF